jgi:anti-anti-sigma factor
MVLETDDAVAVIVHGDVDRYTAGALIDGLADAASRATPTGRRLVVDLAGTDFLGVEGMRALVAAAAANTGRGVTLRGVPPLAQRLIATLGFGPLFTRDEMTVAD